MAELKQPILLLTSVGQPMTLETQGGHIVLTPKRTYTLTSMMAQCDARAPPAADLADWDLSRPVGQEVFRTLDLTARKAKKWIGCHMSS